MRVYGYGEDSLTLWALRHRLDVILEAYDDKTLPADCQVFYRPSFGRSGGDNSSQFGEFDFIILAKHHLYLGESKWDRSSVKIEGGVLKLEGVQARRHEIFKAYVKHWAFGEYRDWEVFRVEAEPLIGRPIPGKDSLLAENLQAILGAIRRHYDSERKPKDVLVYFHRGEDAGQIPQQASDGFKLVPMEYETALGNYIEI
jgi:hypothetical protein